MKIFRSRWTQTTGGVVLLSSAIMSFADVRQNPYNSITERNAFALKPPLPPPEITAPAPPPPPPTTVELTGIVSILGPVRACLEISPGPGKPPVKPILAVGERLDNVEVVAIDIEKSQVIIKNSGYLTNLTFRVAKATTPTPPNAPSTGGSMPAGRAGFAHPVQPQPNSAAVGGSVPFGNGNASGRGVMVLGGGSGAPDAGGNAGGGAVTSFGGPSGSVGATPTAFTPASNPNVFSGTDPNRAIPTRQIRTADLQNTLSAEDNHLLMEVARQQFENNQIKTRSGVPVPPPPMPPTMYTPHLKGE